MKVRVFTAIIIILVGGLVLTITSGAGWYREESTVAFAAGNLVRLHVIAHSNQETDQRVKLRVRDRILKETEKLLVVEDREKALAVLAAHREDLARAAEEELRKAGLNYNAGVELGEFEFPERAYEFGVLPAGKYQAIRVVLGAGGGENWWCVLFPPVCHLSLAEKTADDTLSPEQIKLRWKAWEELKAEYGEDLKQALVKWLSLFQLATVVR
ncbi:MAG: stage II sporulation protein R [Firmicutes bacterium]|nr:stage II sporulation protein R [Bacillota bacterium]